MSLANISIVGNLVRTPEQMYFASGKTKTTIFVAVNIPSRINKGVDGADFYKVEAWGKLAELSATYLAKGQQITATGRLIMDKWTDKEGRERVTPTVRADQIAFPRLRAVDDSPRAAPISGELEFADESDRNNHTVADINATANALQSPSAMTSSKSADASKAATTAIMQPAVSRKSQTA